MSSVKEMFKDVIGQALENVELISDNYQKTMALTNIAQALAATGLVGEGDIEVSTAVKEEKKEKKENKPKKTADKLKRQPKDLPVEEEPKTEEPEAEETPTQEEVRKESPKQEFTEEWTDEAIEAFSEELNYIADFTEKWGSEAANTCLADFSEGLLTDVSADVNPLNIKGVVEAFRALEADAESAA